MLGGDAQRGASNAGWLQRHRRARFPAVWRSFPPRPVSGLTSEMQHLRGGAFPHRVPPWTPSMQWQMPRPGSPTVAGTAPDLPTLGAERTGFPGTPSSWARAPYAPASTPPGHLRERMTLRAQAPGVNQLQSAPTECTRGWLRA